MVALHQLDGRGMIPSLGSVPWAVPGIHTVVTFRWFMFLSGHSCAVCRSILNYSSSRGCFSLVADKKPGEHSRRACGQFLIWTTLPPIGMDTGIERQVDSGGRCFRNIFKYVWCVCLFACPENVGVASTVGRVVFRFEGNIRKTKRRGVLGFAFARIN